MIGDVVVGEDVEFGIAVALGEVTEELVVGAVFFDDVDDVFDERGIAELFGNGDRFG